jgi:hypothetical protein
MKHFNFTTMKKIFFAFLTILSLILIIYNKTNAQIDAGADLVSSYIWRGTTLADGPSIQPWLSYTTGSENISLEIGAWGSYAMFGSNGRFGTAFSEADLYATLKLGDISFTITDYFFPFAGLNYFDYKNAHTLEASVGAELGSLSLLATYNFAGARDLGGTIGENDPGIYFEAAYAFENGINVFLGVGDEFYGAETNTNGEDSPKGSFGVVNVGVGYEKTIIGGIPAFGQIVLNPSTETFGIVFGVRL